MADPHHDFSRHLVQSHERELDSLLQQDIYRPIFLYHVVFMNCLPLIGLIIPSRRGTRYVRYSIFALIVGVAFEVLRKHRALLGGNGYMIGLLTAWWLLWSAGLLVFTDVERDFQRIERVPKDVVNEPVTNVQEPLLPGPRDVSPSQTTVNGLPENRKHFRWQSYPQKFSHRLEWCAGLLFNLRGPEWNWRVSHMGPLPRSVHAQLFETSTSKSNAADDATYINAKARLRAAAWTCLQSYLLLDVLKFVMMRDPYFRGTASADSIPPYPLSGLAAFPLLIRVYRSFLGCMGVYVALNYVTSFNPICFLGLSLAFSDASRKLTLAPLDEPWLYADTFGPFIPSILDHGLAGCWGRWWHQLFRHGFTVTAQWAFSFLPKTWANNSQVKRTTHVGFAFVLSGLVHGCGSHTQFADTRPFSGPFLFFAMQIVAIFCESIFKNIIFPRLPLHGTPRWIRQAANAIFVLAWLLYSGMFIANDFARGGLWLMEPVPISPLRGLGLADGGGWWCWKDPWFRYWSDGTNWGSGIRVT